MRLGIITSEAHSGLGWGTNPEKVDMVKRSLERGGVSVELLSIESEHELSRRMGDVRDQDLVWPNGYHLFRGNGQRELVSLPTQLESWEIPYVGSTAEGLDLMLDKRRCQERLRQRGVPVPGFVALRPDTVEDTERLAREAELYGPVIVKPAGGTSRSEGISDSSIVDDPREIQRLAKKLFDQFGPEVLVEEFLPGEEFTVGFVGYGRHHVNYVGQVNVLNKTGDRVILDRETRLNRENIGLSRLNPKLEQRVKAAGRGLASALGIRDFSRVDGRFNAYGQPRFFDVNGLPGLPTSSYLPEIVHRHLGGEDVVKNYDTLIHGIVHSAAQRQGIDVPRAIKESAMRLANYK